MAVALMIAMGALGLAAVVAWLMAVRTARRIPQPASAPPGKPRNLAGIVRAAFSPTDEDKADPALQKQLRTQVQIALACLITMAVASSVTVAIICTIMVKTVFGIAINGVNASININNHSQHCHHRHRHHRHRTSRGHARC